MTGLPVFLSLVFISVAPRQEISRRIDMFTVLLKTSPWKELDASS